MAQKTGDKQILIRRNLTPHPVLPSIPRSRSSVGSAQYSYNRIKCAASLDKLPDDVLFNILSYLNPGDLLSVACICQRFFSLANDNFLWRRIHKLYFTKTSDDPHCLWKIKCVKGAKEKRLKFLKKLKPDPFTSLCTGFNQIIDLKITWTLILTDHDGNNHKYYSEDFFSFKTSASVRWFSLESLCLSRIRRIRIIASTPLFYNFKSKKALGRTSTKSLIYDEKFNWSKVNVTNIAGDDRIDIYYIRSNLMLAAWKGNDEAAFWHYLLPCQDLLDRCLKGNVERLFFSSSNKPRRDDIDPKYGLHGYTCIIELRNQRQSTLCERFRNINFSEKFTEPGWIAFPLINLHESRIYLSKPLDFLWKTELFRGKIKDFVICDLTVINEDSSLLICDCIPVRAEKPKDFTVDYDYEEKSAVLRIIDNRFKLEMEIYREESSNRLALRVCILYLSTTFINQVFGTSYSL